MKKKLMLLIVAAIGSLMMTKPATDVLSEVGLTMEEAQNTIFNQVKNPNLFMPPTAKMQVARKIAVSNRAAVAESLVKLAQGFVQSETFKTQYADYVESSFPVDMLSHEEQQIIDGATLQTFQNEEKNGRNAYKGTLDATTQGFAQMPTPALIMMAQQQAMSMERELPTMPTDQQAKRKVQIAELKEIQKIASSDPNTFKTKYLDYFKRLTTGMVDEHPTQMTQEKFNEMATKAYEKQEKIKRQQAEKDAHADLNTVIKKHLNTFISLCESVDFQAKTEKKGTTIYFTEKENELKPKTWKLLYRMGKEPTNAAKMAAQNWLKTIQ